MSTIIELTYSRKTLEEVYNLEEQGNVFRNRDVRGMLVAFLIVTILLGVSSYYSVTTDKYIVLTVMIGVFWIAAVVKVLTHVVTIIKWKRDVDTAIDGLVKYRSTILEVSENGFLLKKDSTEVFESWKNVTSFRMETNFVLITTKENYIFPKACMSESAFAFLTETIRESAMPNADCPMPT
jgi:hypothetical protein